MVTSKKMWFSSALLLLVLNDFTWSAANKTVRNKQDSLMYLNKYGYNSCSNAQKSVACNVKHASMLREFQQRHDLKITGVLDAPTIRQMNEPRCGNSDIRSSTSNNFKWSRSSLTWSIRSYPRQISKARVSSLIRDAFNTWLDHISLQIKETCSTCSADIKFDFGRSSHNGDGEAFDGPEGALAYALFPENGTIYFDSDEQWTES